MKIMIGQGIINQAIYSGSCSGTAAAIIKYDIGACYQLQDCSMTTSSCSALLNTTGSSGTTINSFSTMTFAGCNPNSASYFMFTTDSSNLRPVLGFFVDDICKQPANDLYSSSGCTSFSSTESVPPLVRSFYSSCKSFSYTLSGSGATGSGTGGKCAVGIVNPTLATSCSCGSSFTKGCCDKKYVCDCPDFSTIHCSNRLDPGGIVMVVIGCFCIVACIPCTIVMFILMAVTFPVFYISWPIIVCLCPISATGVGLIVGGAFILASYTTPY